MGLLILSGGQKYLYLDSSGNITQVIVSGRKLSLSSGNLQASASPAKGLIKNIDGNLEVAS